MKSNENQRWVTDASGSATVNTLKPKDLERRHAMNLSKVKIFITIICENYQIHQLFIQVINSVR
jgi:hypothetical protein